MKKVLKWVGIFLGGVIALFLIALGVIYYLSNRDLNARHDIEPVALEIPEPDSALLARLHGVTWLIASSFIRDPLAGIRV